MKGRLIILLFLLLIPFMVVCQKSGFVEIEDGTLHYKTYGEGNPLLFINGGPGLSSAGYENIAYHLKSIRQVILFDQRGTGKSKIRTLDENSINISKMVGDIEALRRHLKIEKWDVLGQSFGGTYAIYYASQYENRVNKLIVSSTAAPREDKYIDFKEFTYLEKDFIKEDQKLIEKLG